MKKITYYVIVCLSMLVGAYACKESQLDNLELPNPAVRSITGEGIVVGNVSLDNQYVRVPFKVSLSGVAEEAFQVGLTLYNDTVTQLINNNTITNAVLMPSSSVEYPSVINVAYGATAGEGIAIVRRSTIERYYGKKLVFALKLSAPGKGNQIANGKSTILVIINTADLMKQTDIHYLTFQGGGTYNVAYQGNYIIGPAGVTIPLIISLENAPSSAFNVKIKDNIDTISTLLAAGTLPADAIHLKAADFTLDTLVRFNTGASSATVRLQIPWPVFDANIVANKKFAFALSLSDNTNHVIHPAKGKVIVVLNPNINLDNNSYITGNGTGLIAQYYTNTQLDPNDGRAPFVTRIDETINFSGDGWPDNVKNSSNVQLSRDNFASRWRGEFLAPVRGEYTFYQTRWDDGSRLYVNGVELVNDYTTQWDKATRKGTIFLERGKRYRIEAHHRENVGGQQAFLEIEVPNILSKRVVPKSQLFPTP
ncbi:PA14 domain-containing protein [Pedobacter sandarakinus]|uniref:PA14 domain-containing protein n=1 Tax=Pedobacter sandarakinus TaxID=353156 RepID=UPI00224862BB|nr:PA14 domain-containing protein [Pedobacter sandarakinus]MCX2573169.1 PA14 domain-containing protein [Pedobacter sandarakinus]